MKFEDNLNKLEGLVDKMESGALKLDEMIAAFEEGRKLVETCRTDLEAIRLKIEKVTQAGAVEPVPVVTNAAGENDIGI
ncbi:MAG: exodeoxyribonuclease VII small subunit [Kiritimatiellae bacterium]|jgi:exodeoxyribonuclease VII small subunit|nr:exodeoxyribonuclease VII small subunit [Kiritimatiellia bacterium]